MGTNFGKDRRTDRSRYSVGNNGPFSFIMLIDDLKPSCPTHKYVDNTTLREILSCNESSSMDVYLNELH